MIGHTRKLRLAQIWVAVLMPLWVAAADAANVLQSVSAAQQGDAYVLRAVMKAPLEAKPASFAVTAPARVVVDLTDAENGLNQNIQKLSVGD